MESLRAVAGVLGLKGQRLQAESNQKGPLLGAVGSAAEEMWGAETGGWAA